jgi:ribose transport system substrate-binding protein
MKKLSFVVSLTTHDNDYQMEQAAAAEEAARRLGVELEIVYGGNDSIVQSQQILKFIQNENAHPDGIIFEPVGGTALPQVARAAMAAGIAWVVLNRDVEYVYELRQSGLAPIFCMTSNHEEIGRIQGRQCAVLLPAGGSVLYITGPSESLVAKQRASGMYETKAADVLVKVMKGRWTEASAHNAVSSWLRLSTSQQSRIDVVASQNDAMALGAQKAFQELPEGPSRDRWLSLPFIGCDGLPKTGQAWVKKGLLAATIVVPPNSGQAVELLVQALNKTADPRERFLTVPLSFPSLDELRASPAVKHQALSATV